jgi:type II secretion system protein I
LRGSSYGRGFTLIEVVIALFILSWVLSSAIYMVHQYADERVRLRERFLANQVAWNHLMEHYQQSQKKKGVDEQAGQKWRWEIQIEKAMGQDLYRYQAQAGSVAAEKYQSSLAVYLVQ